MQTDIANPGYSRYLPRLALLGLVLFVLWRLASLLCESWNFTTDDAYITLEYARNLVEGHGLRWITDRPPIEGYSNFSYVLLASASMALGIDPIWTLKAVGVLSLIGTCALVFLLARRWTTPLGALVPVALFISHTGTTYWAASGLETAFYQFLVLLSIWLFTAGIENSRVGISEPPSRHQALLAQHLGRSPAFVACGVVAFLASITRLEGPAVGTVLIGILSLYAFATLRSDTASVARSAAVRRAIALLIICFAVPTAAYMGWRLAYFGELLPHTYYCKTDVSYEPFRLLENYWREGWPYVVAALFFPWKKADLRAAALAVFPVLYLVLLYDADTIISHHLRLYMPAFAPLCIIAGVGVAYRFERVLDDASRYRLFVLTAVVAVSMLIWEFNNIRTRALIENVATDYSNRVETREQLADWLNRHIGSDGYVAIGDVGVVGYRANANIIDLYCLNSQAFTNDEIDKDPVKFARWVLLEQPEAIVIASRKHDRMVPRGPFAINQKLLEHRSFAKEYMLSEKIGGAQDEFVYWVYVRRHAAP